MDDPRYQVFVSSTFRDLKHERSRVSQILLQMRCIPAGMELFPAADEEQLEFIKKVIDDCDYYLVIVAGRYGSVDEEGISFTEREFDYAVSKGLKVIALLHEEPSAIPAVNTELDTSGRQKLEAFRRKAQTARLTRTWRSPGDLAAEVAVAISWLKTTYPATGWIRADQVADSSAKEVYSLRQRVQDLQAAIRDLEQRPPPGSEELAQGEDRAVIAAEVVVITKLPPKPRKRDEGLLSILSSAHDPVEERKTIRREASLTWNELFAGLGPLMMDEASDGTLKRKLQEVLGRRLSSPLREAFPEASFVVVEEAGEYERVLVQLKALGLVMKSEKKHTASDRATYWSLTPRGDRLVTTLVAAKRDPGGL